MLNVKLKKTEDLLKVLSTAENILSENKSENKLKFIKLENFENKLKISAINSYLKIEYLLKNVETIAGDAALYDCKTLLSLINVINEDITIQDGEIKCSKVKYKIPCEDDSDYPKIEFPDVENWAEINTEQFINAITNVMPATDKITDGAMSGVYIGENKTLACDSKKIFMQNIEVQKGLEDLILPKELIKQIIKLPLEEKIYIGTNYANIVIKDNNLKISSAKLSAKYPTVETILPKTVKHTIKIKKADLNNALTLITPIIDDDTKECILEYNNDIMHISADNGIDKAETHINIESNSNEQIKVKFNSQYLLDMLKVNQENITVKVYEDNIGYMFESNGSRQYIMPMIN